MGLFDKYKDPTPSSQEPKPEPQNNQAELLDKMQQMFQQMLTPIQQEMTILKSQVAQGGSQLQQPAQPEPEPQKRPSIFDNAEALDDGSIPISQILKAFRDELGDDVRNVVTEAIKPIGEKFQQTQANQQKSKIEQAWINFTQGKGDDNKLLHPDWQEWKDDMFQTMKEKGGLTFEEAYDLVKIRAQRTSPERYTQVQEKYWPKPKEEDSKAAPYGGWLSQNIGLPTGDTTVSSVGEAASLALKQMKDEGWGDLPLSDTNPSDYN